MTIFILRHGETDFNKQGIVQGSGVDTDLNETGRAQANAFFQTYRETPFDLVVTSTLKRTLQTITPFIDSNIPLLKTPDINEISWGEHEGKSGTPERLAVFRQVVDDWKNRKYDASLPGGESATALATRLNRFIQWMKSQPAKNLLVCTHGRTMRALVTLMKNKELAQMEDTKHANTGCYIVRLQNNHFIFDVENSISHLVNLSNS